MLKLLFICLLTISYSYAHNNEQTKRMEAKRSVELKYNQEQFKIIQNKINVINEQQQLILNEIESLNDKFKRTKKLLLTL